MKPPTINYRLQTKKGFTLVESLVAITILIIGVLGPMMAATRGITDGLYAQNQLIASSLAQEGLELLSNQLDNNQIKNNGDTDGNGSINASDFLYGLDGNSASPNCVSSSFCTVEVNDDASFTWQTCDVSAGECNIVFDLDKKLYRFYNSGLNSSGPIFIRALTIIYTPPTSGNAEALLKSTIKWKNKASELSFKEIVLTRYANHNLRYY